MSLHVYRLSTPPWTFCVWTNDSQTITDAAPVARNFIGQRLTDLKTWLRQRHGSVSMDEVKLKEQEG